MATAKDATGSSLLLNRRVSNTFVCALALAALLLIMVLVQLRSLHSFDLSTTTRFPEDFESFEHRFATKTKYWDQRNEEFGDTETSVMRPLMALPALAEVVNREPLRQELKLIQTQIVARHGSRYPTGGNIQEIQDFLERVQVFEDKLPTWLRNYTLPYNLSVEGELAVSGKHELRDFGSRSLARGGHSGKVDFSKEKYRIAHTHVTRTRDSAIAFAEAFFVNAGEVEYIEYPKSKDILLRFFDECARYLREVKHNEAAQEQMHEFQRSTIMAQNAKMLKRSLGLESESIEFSAKDLMAVQSACAFNIALYHRKDDWCSLMSRNFVRSLEYLDDLKEFYWIGAGYKINYEMAAVLLREIFDTMRAKANGTNSLAGNFFFAHAETTLPLMTLLGYGDRSSLLANATESEIASRGFRTSILSPFAVNVEFRLFKRTSHNEEFYVQILANEKKGNIPGCSRVYCKLSELEQQWHYYLKTYNFHEDCH